MTSPTGYPPNLLLAHKLWFRRAISCGKKWVPARVERHTARVTSWYQIPFTKKEQELYLGQFPKEVAEAISGVELPAFRKTKTNVKFISDFLSALTSIQRKKFLKEVAE